jgi:hypothetical protein
VQIYLLQMAEHTRVDLAAAVLDKLQRNARKYPAPDGSVDVTLPALPVDADQALTHVLLDYENVQPTDEQVRALVPDAASAVGLPRTAPARGGANALRPSANGLTVVPISQTGKNALDFHLSFYMGYIAARNPHARFVVLANDKGYEPDARTRTPAALRRAGHRPAARAPCRGADARPQRRHPAGSEEGPAGPAACRHGRTPDRRLRRHQGRGQEGAREEDTGEACRRQ